MFTRKGWYLKYWNIDWKEKKAGRLDGAKECRHNVPTGNKVELSKTRNIAGGCKLLYNKAERRNEIEIVVREELAASFLKVKRVSDRLMAIKLEVKGLILNIVSAYALQVNNSMEEKKDLWENLDGLI